MSKSGDITGIETKIITLSPEEKKKLIQKQNEQFEKDLAEALTIEESNARINKLKQESEGTTKLSILIATTEDRREMFNILCQEFYRQIQDGNFQGKGRETWKVKLPVKNESGEFVKKEDGSQKYHLAGNGFQHPMIVELKHIEDNREMILGDKRNALLEKANGKYIVFFDSDDFPKPNYVSSIMKALESNPDCVGFRILMTTNGQKPETCIHSLSNKEWTHNGKAYLRNCTHFNPVRKDLALQAKFPSIRFGEDKVYSDRVSALCKTEVFIDEFLFDYRYSDKMKHDEKYGLNKDVK